MTELLLASTVLICMVLLIRGLLGGWMSMRLRYGLWGLVLLRLLLPIWLPGRPVNLVPVPVHLTWEAVGSEEPIVPPIFPTANGVPDGAEQGMPSQPPDQTSEPVSRSDVLRTIWCTGACCVGGYLLLSNILFYRRLRRGAVPLEQECPVPVYQTEDPAAPCLTGLLRPRIYLPKALPSQEGALGYILAHEQCHLRHGDNWWALLRGLCLAVWWFHPLVWVAAVYARRDCELACDEAVLTRLGREARIPYGETLVSLAARQRGGLLYAATGLTAGGRAMRERLNQLLHGKRRLWATALALLLALLAAACTFTEAPADSVKETKPLRLREESSAPVLPAGRREGVYTFLLAGIGGGGQADTLLLAAYDTMGQTLNVMSIPRDTMVDIPWDIKRISGVYSLNGGGAQGQAALGREVSRLVGFDPDYVIRMDWNAVGAVVDAVGGVPFEVPIEMDYDDPTQDLHIHISKGYQILDGTQAMGVIRYRHGNDNRGYINGDLGRIETQQAFLQALAGQILSAPTMTKLTALVEVIQARVTTGLSGEDMLWFAKTAVFDGTPEIRFFTLPCTPYLGWSETYQCRQSYLQPQREALLELINRYFNPYQAERTAEDLELLQETA